MIKLSVVIITYNEERNLARCLRSLSGVADEIVIVDSNSTDGTVEIAKSFGAKIFQHDFIGYGQQKNMATEHASNDWILNLDADEELTHLLKSSLEQLKKAPRHDVYEMSRLTNYCGQWIKHCGWYPDKQTRLYNRTKGKWIEKRVHEYWKLNDEKGKKGLLTGDLLHYSFGSITEHLKKIEKYTELAARAAVAEGKTASLLKIAVSPKWHFISEYFFKLGFLDGFNGYTICRLSSYATFIKYTRIRLYSKESLKQSR